MGEYYQLGRRFRYERSLSFRNDQPIRHGDVGTVIEVRIRAVRQVDPVPLALVLPGLGELAVVGGRRIDEFSVTKRAPAAFCRRQAAENLRKFRLTLALYKNGFQAGGRKAAGFLHNSFHDQDYGFWGHNALLNQMLRSGPSGSRCGAP